MWLRPTPTKVDVAAVSREAMTVTVDGEGKTVYVTAMWLLRQLPGVCEGSLFVVAIRLRVDN
jgi:hypothetical protein